MQVSPRHLGALLAEAGLSFQRTRTWKASPDPDYESKTARILELCEKPLPGAVVVSFDQMGPASLRPMAGAGWAPRGRPERQRADYTRRHSTRYLFGAFDVDADRLRIRLRPKRRGQDMLAFVHQIRSSYPARQRIYWNQDNLSANWAAIAATPPRTRSSSSRPRPTRATLNPVECNFSVISQFVVCNADYLDWDAFALARHVTYSNAEHRDHRIAAAQNRCRVAP